MSIQQKVLTELKRADKEFAKLITERKEKLDAVLEPLCAQFNKINYDVDHEFGDYLLKVLGARWNTTAVTNGSVGVSKTPFLLQYNKRSRIRARAYFHALSRNFLACIKQERQRTIFSDFLAFREATIMELAKYKDDVVYLVDAEAETIEVDSVVFTSGVAPVGDPKNTFNCLKEGSQQKQKISSVRLVFTKKWAQVHDNIGEYLPKNNMPPSINVLLIGKNDCLIDHCEIFFRTRTDFGSKASACLLSGFANIINGKPAFARGKTSIRQATKNGVYPEEQHIYEERNTKTFVAHPFTRILELGVKYDPKVNDKHLVINWSEILQDPVIEKQIKAYADSWSLISRAWAYLQTKYSHRLITNGSF